MGSSVDFPGAEELLRTIITAAGLRPYILGRGLTKQMDNLARGNTPKPSAHMAEIENELQEFIASECGENWAIFAEKKWRETKGFINYSTKKVVFLEADASYARSLYTRSYHQIVIPNLMMELLRERPPLKSKQEKLPALQKAAIISAWYDCPFKTWVSFMSNRFNISNEQILETIVIHSEVHPRALTRWMDGDKIKKISHQYRGLASACIKNDRGSPVQESELDLMTGWLLIAVAFQSIPRKKRIETLQNIATKEEDTPDWMESAKARAYLNQTNFKELTAPIEMLLEQNPLNAPAVEVKLAELKNAITTTSPQYQFLYDFYAARSMALQGMKKEASKLFLEAVSGSKLLHPSHQDILAEAMIYTFGVKSEVAFKSLWDKARQTELKNDMAITPTDEDKADLGEWFRKLFPTLTKP